MQFKMDCDGTKSCATVNPLHFNSPLVDEKYNETRNRVLEVKKWTSKLKLELKANISQSHDMLELKERLDAMLKNIAPPLDISQENLFTREGLKGADKIKDIVEEFLLREIETLRRSEETLLEELEKVNFQLHRLRMARNEIEIDIANKNHAQKNDECTRLLHALANEVDTIGFEVPVSVPQSMSSPSLWLTTTLVLFQKSHEARKSSNRLYTSITRLMIKSADECFSVWYATNAAFERRIRKITQVKQVIEGHLEKNAIEIKGLQCQHMKIEKFLDERQLQLQAAQAKLDKRKGDAKQADLCRDPTLIGILRDIHSLKAIVANLTGRQDKLNQLLAVLHKTKATLEHDVRFKNVALHIDREKCLTLRQTFPISTFNEARFSKKSGPTREGGPMLR